MRSVPPDDAALLRRLRAEADRDRPAFDGVVHGRILTALAVRARERADAHVASPWWLLAAAACIGLVSAAIAWRGDSGPAAAGWRGGATTATPAAPDLAIDAWPTLDELGAGVEDGIGVLAASVVGIPDWRELAVSDLPMVAPWGVDAASGGREGPADLWVPR